MKRLFVAALFSLALLEVSATPVRAHGDWIGPNGGCSIGLGVRGPYGGGLFVGLLSRRPSYYGGGEMPMGDIAPGYAMDAPVVDPALSGYAPPAYAGTPYNSNSGVGQASYAYPDYWYDRNGR